MNRQLEQLREFHATFGAHLEDRPTAEIPDGVRELRVSLIQEELDEYRRAAEENDLVGIADALTDLAYVVFGTVVAHGLHAHAAALFDEVHRSNMSKLDEDGRPVYRDDGKVLKSRLFREPDLERVLGDLPGPGR